MDRPTDRASTVNSVLQADETCTYRATGDGKATEYVWEVLCYTKTRIPVISDRVEEQLVDKAKGNAARGLSKMEALTQEVHRLSLARGRPAFMRWPTRANAVSTPAASGSHGAPPVLATLRAEQQQQQLLQPEQLQPEQTQAGERPEPRRSWFFGARSGPGEAPSAGGGSAPKTSS